MMMAMMRRLVLVLWVLAVVALMAAVSAAPAFAQDLSGSFGGNEGSITDLGEVHIVEGSSESGDAFGRIVVGSNSVNLFGSGGGSSGSVFRFSSADASTMVLSGENSYTGAAGRITTFSDPESSEQILQGSVLGFKGVVSSFSNPNGSSERSLEVEYLGEQVVGLTY